MKLYQLVYTSARRCSDADIHDILSSCKKNNPGKNITGILLHSDQRFIQIMEGEKDVLEKLFSTVKEDKRHAGVNLRFFGPVEKRHFPDWHMGFKDLNTKKLKLNTSVRQEDIDTYEAIINNEDIFSQNEGMRVLTLFSKVSM